MCSTKGAVAGRSSRVKQLEDATTLLMVVAGIDAWTWTRGGNSRSHSTLVRELGPRFPDHPEKLCPLKGSIRRVVIPELLKLTIWQEAPAGALEGPPIIIPNKKGQGAGAKGSTATWWDS